MKNKANPSNLDVIIPVHNALADVKNCINSVLQNTSSNFSIIIVNDGSDDETSLYLRNVTESDERVELLVNNEAQGYTKAANKGLKHSNADYKVLLNSDTIVPQDWDKKLIACAVTEEAGLVGPLSNAASWQSVPNRFSADGGWAINQLPDGFDVNKFDKLVENVSTKSNPHVKILNGFCTLFKKEVFDKIGYLDEESFPRGYGEENDLCFRANDAGFKIVIATDTYVYHAKSRSFGKKARNELAQKGSEALTEKHGNDRINKAVFSLKHNRQLEETRTAISNELKKIKKKNEKVETETLNVLFLLPISGVAGGIHSIYQEMTGMRELGVNAKIATWHYNKPDYERAYSVGDSVSEQFYFFNGFDEVTDYAGKFDVVVATIHNSIILLKRIYQKYPNILPAYYVQDYEPFFFEQGSEQWKIANDSYTLIPDMMLFAKTDWLCKTVESFHNKKVEKVVPSLDTSVYYPNFSKNNQQEKTKIVAMVRPSTPRRGAERTMRVLKRIQNMYGNSVEINIFGTVEERFEDFNLT
ncbi:MAG: glycosyltransferase, partial [Ignavibacteriales bacterium]